jgi:hypothetical protein
MHTHTHTHIHTPKLAAEACCTGTARRCNRAATELQRSLQPEPAARAQLVALRPCLADSGSSRRLVLPVSYPSLSLIRVLALCLQLLS